MLPELFGIGSLTRWNRMKFLFLSFVIDLFSYQVCKYLDFVFAGSTTIARIRFHKTQSCVVYNDSGMVYTNSSVQAIDSLAPGRFQ